MNLKFIPPIIVLVGAVGFMVWFVASGAAMPSG
ncbi:MULTISPECIES: YoaK family small membrane protein [Rahnella]